MARLETRVARIAEALLTEWRSVRPALEDAFNRPVRDVERLVDNQGRVSYRYTGENATVVVNEQGKVITGWANNSTGTAGGVGG